MLPFFNNMTDPRQALTEAYDAYADAIYRHCYFRVFRKERAQELMQETFTKTWEYLCQGHSVDNLRAFLYRVANNLIIDESRKKKEHSLEALQDVGFDLATTKPLEQLVNKLDADTVLTMMEQLEERSRTVLVMRYVDGLGPEEIADALGETANVVSVRLHRAISQVRKLLPYE